MLIIIDAAALKPDAERGIGDYLDRYFYAPETWTDYLSRLGLDALLDAGRRGRSIYDD